MSNDKPRTIFIYGREVHLDPLAPGETVEDVVVVARTRGPNGPAHTFTAAQDEQGAPRQLDDDIRFLIDLGIDRSWANSRIGRHYD